MAKSIAATVKELASRVRDQALEVATLREALEVQFARIAQLQAELDALPHARRRRQSLRQAFAGNLSQAGNGRGAQK